MSWGRNIVIISGRGGGNKKKEEKRRHFFPYRSMCCEEAAAKLSHCTNNGLNICLKCASFPLKVPISNANSYLINVFIKILEYSATEKSQTV
jgi:hypothetical protein